MSKSKVRVIARLVGRIVLLLLLVVGLGLGSLSMFSRRPDNLGHADGRLAPCPASPNCVSTQTDSAEHQMTALSFSGTPADALARLKQVVSKTFPRAVLVREEPIYLYYEFRSFLFRFVDDVEFLVDEPAGEIHFRSASRVGHSDMGVNRARMTKIAAEFNR
ncbi:MAG: DUF1499 domain-containing protein [Pirellulaceae bacterium]|nr:DUF1499 domain-containing protein [Pirellulaceae bacterium]